MPFKAGPLRRALLTAVPMLVAGTTLGLAATADEQIAQRRAGYKHMGDNFGEMKQAVEKGTDVAPLAAKAHEIVEWAKRIPTLFPPGTETGGGTHARPEIWSDRDGFDKASRDLLASATLLEQRAASGDKAAFADQFKATGATCGACHRTYRYKL